VTDNDWSRVWPIQRHRHPSVLVRLRPLFRKSASCAQRSFHFRYFKFITEIRSFPLQSTFISQVFHMHLDNKCLWHLNWFLFFVNSSYSSSYYFNIFYTIRKTKCSIACKTFQSKSTDTTGRVLLSVVRFFALLSFWEPLRTNTMCHTGGFWGYNLHYSTIRRDNKTIVGSRVFLVFSLFLAFLSNCFVARHVSGP